MKPEDFHALESAVLSKNVLPQEMELSRLRIAKANAEGKLDRHKRFLEWHRFLANGETPAGSFGMSPTFGFFVSRYAAEGPEDRNESLTVKSVELLIVPALLVDHELRVNIPNADKPGTFTNTSMEVDVPGIVERMRKFTGNATNVSVGSIESVHREACEECKQPALVVACDEHIDDDNGRVFRLARFCASCAQVDEFATYSVPDPRDFSGRTDGIYRRTEEKP